MSVVGHFLETAGIATTGISLIREHSAGMKPPRALWVPFELGRPFGPPSESAFQRRVLEASLALLVRTDGPVILADFPEPEPQASAQLNSDSNPADSMQGMFCALPLPKPANPNGDPVAAARAEIAALAPWHAMRMAEPGVRSITGTTGLNIEQIADFLVALYQGEAVSPAPSLNVAQTLRLAAEELRLWCIEAALAKPGSDSSSAAIDLWFWGGTACARLILVLQPVCVASEDLELAKVATGALIPIHQRHRLASA